MQNTAMPASDCSVKYKAAAVPRRVSYFCAQATDMRESLDCV
jgi:hypothetical protein